jgi:hypothetical protein
MEGAFDPAVTDAWRCSGRRPWLATGAERCTEHRPKVLQRGASNLYFPVVESSLLIPPWDDDVETRLGNYWPDVLELQPADREARVRALLDAGRIDIPSDWIKDRFVSRVMERVRAYEGLEIANLREEEWSRFVGAGNLGESDSRDFEVREERVPDEVADRIDYLARAVRLRELRALKGFTRVNPPAAAEDPAGIPIAPISLQRLRWLPAVEVRGEGIFISLNRESILAWERHATVVTRASRLEEAFVREYRLRRGDDAQIPRSIPPRFVLAHTLAHALMRQLSLECGYSTASLRERLYVGNETCGFLIYTATTDSDGTLGGLQRQGQTRRIGQLLKEAVRSQRWCSSDPLCISGAMMLSNDTNGASCHACTLAPETSCEEFNRFLDRAFLVGLPDDPDVGFFRAWLE